MYAILLERKLGGLASPDPRQGVSFSVAREEDIKAIMEHPEALSKTVYLNRIRNGDLCFCLKQDGELVSYNWARFTTCCFYCGRRVSFRFIPLRQNQVFVYDLYTYDEHRGKGFGGYLKSCIVYELQSRSISEMICIVEPANYISLRVHIRLGSRIIAVIFGYGLLNWTTTFLGSKRDVLRMRQWMKNVSDSINTR